MATKREDESTTEFTARLIQIDAWNKAIDAAVSVVPGGSIVDPQIVADEIRALRRED